MKGYLIVGLWLLTIVLQQPLKAQESKGSEVSQTALEEYLLIAAENNPGLRARFNEYMAALEKVPQAGALPDPQLAFGYFINPVETRLGPQKATLGLSQAFPWFGTLGAQRDAVNEMALSEYELFEDAKANLFFEVTTAYYNCYFIEKAIEISRENIEILRIFKNLSLVKIETGSASLVDELRVELELNDLENQLALYLDSRKVFQTRFNNLLNRDSSVKIDMPSDLEELPLPIERLELLDSILVSNRQIRSIDHKLNSFVRQEEAARKSGLPKFNVGMSYIFIGENPMSVDPDNGKDAILFPTVGLSIPIYRKKYKSMIQEAEYRQEAVVAGKEEKRNRLNILYEENLREYNDSSRRVVLNERQSEIATKVLDLLITSYSTNSKDFEEVLRIERQLLGYKLARERALIDKNVSVAFMKYLLGH